MQDSQEIKIEFNLNKSNQSLNIKEITAPTTIPYPMTGVGFDRWLIPGQKIPKLKLFFPISWNCDKGIFFFSNKTILEAGLKPRNLPKGQMRGTRE